jgi:hypothetical protein
LPDKGTLLFSPFLPQPSTPSLGLLNPSSFHLWWGLISYSSKGSHACSTRTEVKHAGDVCGSGDPPPILTSGINACCLDCLETSSCFYSGHIFLLCNLACIFFMFLPH